ncbi:MAG TPA: M56 family metallopeptidase [Pirellulales bacterium]
MLSLLETLGWWGIDFHLPAGVLLLAVTVCLIRVRQPARRRAIGGAAAVGLLLLALLTVLPGWPHMAWRQAPPRHALPQITEALPNAGTPEELLTVNSSAMPEWNNLELAPAPGHAPLATGVRQAAQADSPSATPQPSAVAPSVAIHINWPVLAGLVVLVGAAWACIWLLLGTVQAARIRRGAKAAGPELCSAFDRIVGAPRHKPQLLISGDTTLPLAMGLFRPAIVLPQSCASTSSSAEVEAAIAHEWAHIRHGDLWLLALLRSLLPLLACQPLFWWLRKIIRTAQEELADAAAADRGGRVAYAEVLLAWARTSPAVLPRGLDGSLALWERPSQLKRRVLTLLDRGFHVELRCSRRRRLAITAVTLTIAGLLSIPTLRQAISADDENAAIAAKESNRDEAAAAHTTSETGSAQAPKKSSHETGAALADAKQPMRAGDNMAVTRGRVLTPDGKPLAGAKLYLTYSNVANVQPQLLGESGDDGRFEFRVDKSQLNTSFTPDPWSTAAITAVAEGFGFEWVNASQTDAEGNLTIKLVKDVPIHGRILTLEGRPVVGAKVKLSMVGAPDGGLDDYVKELRGGLRGDRALQSSRLGRSAFPGMRDTAVTDAEGRFTLAGIGGERVVQMLVTSDEAEHVVVRALTREIDPIEPPQTGPGWGAEKTYGAMFEFLARPSRTIVGTVREKSGQPLPGISIRSFSGAGLTATTDAQGRYELIGHSKAPQYQVRVIPENMPYFGTMLNIADTPGLDPIVADIELSRGIAVEGRVTAGPNGEPNEATVEYHPLFGNQYVERIGQLPAVNQAAASATCDAEGRYGIPVLPGPGVLTFKYGPWYRQAVARDYLPAWLDREKVGQLYRSLGIEQPETDGNFLRTETGSNRMAIIGLGMYNQALLINPDENEDSLTRDVQLELGRTLNVTIETADGKPPADLTVRGRTNLRFVSEKIEAPEFQVTGLHPKIERELTIEAREQKLGAYRVIHGDEEGPITLRLQPCGAVSGRLLDEDGEPLANTALGVGQVRVMPPEFSATTDKDGKFRLDGLVPGMPYGITLRRQGQMGQGMRQLATDVVVAPGKTQDLGDLDLKPKAMPRPGGFGRVPGAAAGSKPNAAKPATND